MGGRHRHNRGMAYSALLPRTLECKPIDLGHIGDQCEALSVSGLFDLALEGPVILPLKVQRQDTEYWCWAALSSALGQYYNTEKLQQCEILCKILNRPYCCEEKTECAEQYPLASGLDVVRVESCKIDGPPEFARLCEELRNHKPVCARLSANGIGHLIAVSGYDAIRKEIMIQDPANGGTSWMSFAAFPENYWSGAQWTHTYWTRPKL